MVIKGSSGEKIGHYSEIPAEPVREDMATNTTIRWLIHKEDGAPLFAMRMFEVRPGGHIKAHKHPWEHEIFILEGKGRIRIGEKSYDVSEGYFVYIPPNVEHEYWNTSDSVLRFLCIIPHRHIT